MKTWLIKFKISNALNDRQPLPPKVAQTIARSEEARRFAETNRALDQALKNQLPQPEDSTPFHAAIMRAVRAASHVAAPEQQVLWPRWTPVAGFVSLVLFGLLLAIGISRQSVTQALRSDATPLAAASSALEQGSRLIRDMPAAAISPLSNEMQGLNHDLVSTGQFLVASLP